MATEPKEQKGVLITGPSGVIYNIPANELERYAVPRAVVERTILDAEAAGFVGESGQDALGETEEVAEGAPPPPPGATIINIFVGPNAEASMLPDDVEQPQARAFSNGLYHGEVRCGLYHGGSSSCDPLCCSNFLW